MPPALNCKNSRRFTIGSFLILTAGRRSVLAKRPFGAEPAGLDPLINPLPDADIEQSEAGGFVKYDLVVGFATRLLAGHDVADVGHHIVRTEFAVGNKRVERLARRIVAQYLLGSRQIHPRAQHGLLAE